MSETTHDEASIVGRGASIMLPARGNPFGPPPPAPEDVVPRGAETTQPVSFAPDAPLPEPQDLSPEELAALFAEPPAPTAAPVSFAPPIEESIEPEPEPEQAEPPISFAVTETQPAPEPLPTMLSPTEIAAMFNEPAPQPQPEAVSFSASAELVSFGVSEMPAEPEPLPTMLSPTEVAAMFNEPLPATAPALPEPAVIETIEPLSFGLEESPPTLVPVSMADPTTASPEPEPEQTSVPPHSEAVSEELKKGEAQAGGHGDEPAGELYGALPASRPTTVSRTPGDDLQVATDSNYPNVMAYRGNSRLVKMFVPDEALTKLWEEIDALEKSVSVEPKLSQKLARQLLGRLAGARNYLMNDRDHYEEAKREVAETRFFLERVRRSTFSDHARFVMAYLITFLIVLTIATLSASNWLALIGSPSIVVFVQTILIGGFGGVTGALYGLWTHVARDQDYDPQFALWYYTNPLMGLLLGGLVYMLTFAGMIIVSSGGQEATPGPATWVVAFAVGFQQNFAFSLLNSALKRLIPSDEKAPEVIASEAKGEGEAPKR